MNDYENAALDAQQFAKHAGQKSVVPLSGSCICCTGINALRDCVNRVPERENGITLIEANGTTDASSLMGFLGVGIKERFLPPIQISVVDVKNWQKRGEYNELEANQIQLSTLIVLTHTRDASADRKRAVINEIKENNPFTEIVVMNEIDITLLPKLTPSKNQAIEFDHLNAHWASCSIDLPKLPDTKCIYAICHTLPAHIIRVKGCVQIGSDEVYAYFERTPDGQVFTRPFNGVPPMGAKLLTVGLGSEPSLLKKAVENALNNELSSHN